MNKNSLYLFISVLLLIIFSLFIFIFLYKNEPAKSPIQPVQSALHAEIPGTFQPIYSVAFPDSVSFAGEPAPTDIFYVHEYLDRELTVNAFWHSATIMLIKRAHRWLPVIEPILKKQGIPDDFKYVAIIESGLENVTSPAGATGFWQLLKTTARERGLEVSNSIDERYHVEKATLAACNYLKESYAKFGNWTLVAASYNAGMKGISDELKKQQVKNYYDLMLSVETTRYIFRIHAIKAIFLQPIKYGFFLQPEDLYPPIPTKNIAVNTNISNLANFAKTHGITYKTLKYFNPWLRENDLPNRSGKTYFIKIPLDSSLSFSKLIELDKLAQNEADNWQKVAKGSF